MIMILLCTLCRHAVSDMAWTPDGMTILACSGDGTIALLMFSEKELGKPPLTGTLLAPSLFKHPS